MFKSRLALLATLVVAATFAITSTASASSGIEISGGPNITATGLTQFSTTGALGTLSCDIQLSGSVINDLVAASELSTIGAISAGTARNCLLNGSTPVTVALSGFNWTLGIGADLLPTVLDATFTVSTPLGSCTYIGDVAFDFDPTVSPITLITTLEATFNGACGSAVHSGGTGFSITPIDITYLD